MLTKFCLNMNNWVMAIYEMFVYNFLKFKIKNYFISIVTPPSE